MFLITRFPHFSQHVCVLVWLCLIKCSLCMKRLYVETTAPSEVLRDGGRDGRAMYEGEKHFQYTLCFYNMNSRR